MPEPGGAGIEISERGRSIISTLKILPAQKWLLALASRTPTSPAPQDAAACGPETVPEEPLC